MKKKALITGINGQDGSFLSELLLAEGYEVHGFVRRESIEDETHRLQNIRHLKGQINLHAASVDDHLAVYRAVSTIQPDECYHLAASSFVSYNFETEASILATNFNSTHHLLSSIKELAPKCKFYFAGSSEMFGNARECPQKENSAFSPRSIYGISKLAGHHLVNNYRSHYGLFACTGILYNHESERRGFEFVTRKITSTVAKISLGLASQLELGNLDAKRDWGYAPEYVEAIHRMMKSEKPQDYVIATGKLSSVRDFLSAAFGVVGLDYQKYVVSKQEFFRPDETVHLCGDSTKAHKELGWSARKSVNEIARDMVLHDLALLKRNQ
jgi:GDPmannose 4,6-dehydratase